MDHNILPLVLLITLSFCQESVAKWFFTALEEDNHPCAPENLKASIRYTCDTRGNVICQPGWREPETETDLNRLNPCLEPICQGGCGHGTCKAPEFCTCEVGWEGQHCGVCVPLPGCMNGLCNLALECNCIDGWDGAFCTIPECKNCSNGYCAIPNKCTCQSGWTGEQCDQCISMPGCVNGGCTGHPNTCECFDGWQGTLCDEPVCIPACLNGICRPKSNGTGNYCLCDSGWKGSFCQNCSPYWTCPNQGDNACTQPNECLCFKGETDPGLLCNNSALIQPGMNSRPGISLPVPIFVPLTSSTTS